MITNESNRPVDVWLQIADKIDLWGARCCMATHFQWPNLKKSQDFTNIRISTNFCALVCSTSKILKQNMRFGNLTHGLIHHIWKKLTRNFSSFTPLMLPPWSLTASAPLKSYQKQTLTRKDKRQTSSFTFIYQIFSGYINSLWKTSGAPFPHLCNHPWCQPDQPQPQNGSFVPTPGPLAAPDHPCGGYPGNVPALV